MNIDRNRLPAKKDTNILLIVAAVYLVATAMFIGLRPEHLILTGLIFVMFFASPFTRKLMVALLPFAVFGMSYDWMRIYPNYEVKYVDIAGIYHLEQSWFGIEGAGRKLIPGEYFYLHNNAFCDIMAGIFYLCWVPVPIAFGIYLYLKGEKQAYLRFALAFLLVNFIGFAGYYIHPAAPPWYTMYYGFNFWPNVSGSPAALIRFDKLTGIGIFQAIYGRNANVFAAVPSLHAAYMLIATIYAVITRRKAWMIALFAFITLGIWWTAVYTTHHYIIDVLLGILTVLLGILLLEQVLMRWRPFRQFINRYTSYIS